MLETDESGILIRRLSRKYDEITRKRTEEIIVLDDIVSKYSGPSNANEYYTRYNYIYDATGNLRILQQLQLYDGKEMPGERADLRKRFVNDRENYNGDSVYQEIHFVYDFWK